MPNINGASADLHLELLDSYTLPEGPDGKAVGYGKAVAVAGLLNTALAAAEKQGVDSETVTVLDDFDEQTVTARFARYDAGLDASGAESAEGVAVSTAVRLRLTLPPISAAAIACVAGSFERIATVLGDTSEQPAITVTGGTDNGIHVSYSVPAGVPLDEAVAAFRAEFGDTEGDTGDETRATSTGRSGIRSKARASAKAKAERAPETANKVDTAAEPKSQPDEPETIDDTTSTKTTVASEAETEAVTNAEGGLDPKPVAVEENRVDDFADEPRPAPIPAPDDDDVF